MFNGEHLGAAVSIPESPKPSKSKLPVWRTAGEAYAFIFRNPGVFVSLAAIPLALSLPLGFAMLLVQPITPDDYQTYLTESAFFGWWDLVNIIHQLIWAIFAVSWHRFVLLGRKDSTGPVQFLLRRRELRFFLYTLIFLLPFYIVSVLSRSVFGRVFREPSMETFQSSFDVLMILGGVMVVAFIIMICCTLIFPAIAVDSDRGFGTAWRQLRGSTWRLIWALVIVVAPFLPVSGAIAQVTVPMLMDAASGADVSWTAFILLLAVNSLLGFLLAAVAVTVLSLAYRHLTGWTPADARLGTS